MGDFQRFLLAVALTAALVDVARRIAPAIGLVDKPNERKAHLGEIPLVGGLAIYCGLIFSLALFGILQDHTAFMVAALGLVVVGAWDDARKVSPYTRLAVQAGAVLTLGYFGDVFLRDLGNLLPGGALLELGWFSVPFTVFVGVGLINAFNMSDGVDGLCGTFALIALAGLGILSGLAGRDVESALIVLLCGGLVGFLIFNVRVPGRSQAKVFLGDAGSYLMGLSILYLTVELSQGEDRAIAPVSALWLCMLPLFDTVGMILRRLRRGKSPFSADREHIHHVFLLAKFTVAETWFGLTVIAFVGMGMSVFWSYSQVSEPAILGLFLASAILYYWMIVRAWKVMRFLSRSINRRTATSVDRRSGIDRRQRPGIYYVNGIAMERRSGIDRRAQANDRRTKSPDDTVEHKNVVEISRGKKSAGEDNRVA